MHPATDKLLAQVFAERYAAARERLLRDMEAAGLHAADGWRISEITRHMGGGTELVLRPMHRYLTAPPEMECVVRIDDDGTKIEFDCAS